MQVKRSTDPRRNILKREPAKLVTRIGLAVIFLLGALMAYMGIRGQNEFSASGFSSERAYQAIYALSGQVSDAWKNSVQPDLNALTEQERALLDSTMADLLRDAWENQNAGAGEEAARLAAEGGERKGEITGKLLYTTYLVNGPKVSTSDRKELLGAKDGKALRLQLLQCMIDESLPLPKEAASLAEGLTGKERQAMLLQAFFVSGGSAGSDLTDNVNSLKKSVRGKEHQLTAFRMIARSEVSWGWQLLVSNSSTAVLLGIILMLDMVLLTLLMMAEKTWIVDFKWIMILLIVDFLLLFQLFPSVYMLIRAFFPEGTFSLSTMQRLYTYSMNLEALKNTLIAAFATMILGTAIAFPLAWLVGRTDLYGKKFFRSLFILTYMVPPYVGAMAWLRLMNPNVGTINQWLRVICISGASPVKTLLTVTLPMMTPSLIAGALLVFISAASCYGIPSIIGIPGNVNTVTTRIVEYVGQGQTGMNDATGLAVFLMVVALLILFVSDVLLAKRQYITVSGKSVRPAIVELRSWRIPMTILVSLFAVIVVVLPFVTILTTSFKVDIGKSVFDASNFTTTNWTSVFARAETIGCLKNSLIFAAVSATVGLVIACVMSYLLQRTRVRGRSIPNFLITLGSGTPSVVIALGLIMTMRGNFGINIYNTAYILIVAYLVKYLMMGMRTVVSAMSQIHVSLEECSQVSGASWLTTMRRITGPLIFPSIAAGWFLIFIPSFYELSMTTLLYSSTTKTIGLQLYEYWTLTSQPMSCAMAFGILLIVVFLNFILNRLTRGEFSI